MQTTPAIPIPATKRCRWSASTSCCVSDRVSATERCDEEANAFLPRAIRFFWKIARPTLSSNFDTPVEVGDHILYLKSSGDIFSKISDHLSRETLDRFFSCVASDCCSTLEASRTFFATKIGLLVRKAREIASLGRESITTFFPPACKQMTA